MTSYGGSGADGPPVQVAVPNTASKSRVPGGALTSGMLGYWETPEWDCWQPGRGLLWTSPWPGCAC